jgi:hypothetical protein
MINFINLNLVLWRLKMNYDYLPYSANCKVGFTLKNEGTSQMEYLRIKAILIALVLTVGLSCSSDPLPDHYGVFLVSKGRIVELGAIPNKEFYDRWNGRLYDKVFNESKEYIPTIADTSEYYFIQYAGELDPIIFPTAKISENECEFNYDVHQNDGLIGLFVTPVEGKTGMYRLKPRVQLKPGVYLLSVTGCRDNDYDLRCYFPFRVP